MTKARRVVIYKHIDINYKQIQHKELPLCKAAKAQQTDGARSLHYKKTRK